MMSASDREKDNKHEDDTLVFFDCLSEFKLRDTALDQQATTDLASRCLAKFDDEAASLQCRSIALYTMVAQIRAGNPSMLDHIPGICQRIKGTCSSVLVQPVTGAGARAFHSQIINAISAILRAYANKLLDKSFDPVIQYLIQTVSCDDVETAILACEFWANCLITGLPTNKKIRKHWMSCLVPKMPTLITSLMGQIIYRPENAQYVEEFGSNPGAKASLPGDVELFANLRNVATVAFERISSVYPSELVCTTFRPVLEERIESESWMEKEAVILALIAFTRGAGTPDAMQNTYVVVIPRILDGYEDPHPLLRCIACLSMTTLVGRRLRGVKNPWSRVLACTAKATRDPNAEVRNTALRALSTLLGYVSPYGSSMHSVRSHTASLVDALVRAGQCDMDPETRCIYFGCVSHLVGRSRDSLTTADMELMVPPLIDAWNSQQWRSGNAGAADPDLGIVPLSLALGTVATYGNSLYAPFAERVFAKACSDIGEIVQSAESKTREKDDDSNGMSPEMTSHIISCLDLLSAHYEGLAAEASPYAAKFHLLPRLHFTLTAESFDERIYQSALALLGHILRYGTGPTRPPVDMFLDLIRSYMETTGAAKTRGNALWALVHASANQTASQGRLFGFLKRLISMFKQTDDDPACIINAAWALTSICASRATHVVSINVITRPDVLSHLSGLIRAPFPRPLEKLAIISNICRMMTPAVDKVPSQQWPVFLSAVAALDLTSLSGDNGGDDLYLTLRSLLREISMRLGAPAWTRALNEMGIQQANELRRRYKIRLSTGSRSY